MPYTKTASETRYDPLKTKKLKKVIFEFIEVLYNYIKQHAKISNNNLIETVIRLVFSGKLEQQFY